MTAILKLNVYQHPDLDFAEWAKTPSHYTKGIHLLKDGTSYTKMNGTSSFYMSAQDTAVLMQDFETEKPAEILPPAPTIGISEETLLAALAIAQKPELAPQLLALRKQ